MDFLDVFNLIASTCSTIGLIVTLVVASKVTKLMKSNNHNSGQIQQGMVIRMYPKIILS